MGLDQPEHETITLPGAVTKNKSDHTFPYGSAVSSVSEKSREQSAYVFPASRAVWRNGKLTTTFNGWGKNKEAFDAACGVTGGHSMIFVAPMPPSRQLSKCRRTSSSVCSTTNSEASKTEPTGP